MLLKIPMQCKKNIWFIKYIYEPAGFSCNLWLLFCFNYKLNDFNDMLTIQLILNCIVLVILFLTNFKFGRNYEHFDVVLGIATISIRRGAIQTNRLYLISFFPEIKNIQNIHWRFSIDYYTMKNSSWTKKYPLV